MAPLRVAIIGSGIGAMHAKGYRWLPELFDLPVLCALDEERSRKVCARYKIPEFSMDFEAVLAREDIDVVDICTPPGQHYSMCEAALAAGKQVICEKPLFGSLAEVDAMEAIVAASGRLLMPI